MFDRFGEVMDKVVTAVTISIVIWSLEMST